MATITGTVNFSGYLSHISWDSTGTGALRRDVTVYSTRVFTSAFSGRPAETPTNPYWDYITASADTRLRNPNTIGYGGTPISGTIFTSAVLVPFGGVTR